MRWTPKNKRCIQCGTEFFAEYPRMSYCSKECNLNHLANDEKHIRSLERIKEKARKPKMCEVCGARTENGHITICRTCKKKQIVNEKLTYGKMSKASQIWLRNNGLGIKELMEEACINGRS